MAAAPISFLLFTIAGCGRTVLDDADRASSDAGAKSVAAAEPNGIDAATGDASVVTVDAAAPSPADLVADCNQSREAFVVDAEGVRGTIQLGKQTYTNLGSDFVAYGPTTIEIFSGNVGGSVELYTSNNALPAPGTYPVDESATSGPYIDVTVGDEGCGASSGSFTIFDAEAGDGGLPASLVLSFDLTCVLDVYGNTDTLRGCLRYAAQ
jgi:hypothetical protein